MTQKKPSGKNWKAVEEGNLTGPPRKVRVLRIKTRLTHGGPDRHVLLLTSGLSSDRFLSYLACGTASRGEDDMTHMAHDMGIDLFVVSEMQREINLFHDFIALLKLCGIMNRIRPHIVHTHTAKAGTLGRVAAFLTGVPIRIHTFHGHVFHSYFGKFKTRAIILIEKILARLTNRIVVISETQLGEVRDRYRIASADKISVVPLGLDIESLLSIGRGAGRPKGIRKDFLVSDDELLVGIIGRLVEIKNHRMFLEAAKKIRQDAPDARARFVIVGDGALRRDLESYARSLGVDDIVLFTGWRNDLVNVYGDIDVVCLTSFNEGTPLSLVEAMAAARPVVATDAGGVRDVVHHGESGFLCPIGDVAAFSSHVIGLLRDARMREDMGKRGRSYVSTIFSQKRLIGDIERLYNEELIKKGITV